MANSYALQATVAGEAPKATAQAAYGRPAYAVPDTPESVVPGYDEGYSPPLGADSDGMLPDPIRTGQAEPVFGGPHTQDIHYARFAESLDRESDEYEHSTGWRVRQEKPEIAVIPLQVQENLPTRPTASMGQNTYMFMRPWDIPGDSTGEHFSMADHRRAYEIYGMKPQGDVGVNTFRLDPKPWDTNLHYNPVPTPPDPHIDVYPSGLGPSFRLG